MTLKILLFAAARDMAGSGEIEMRAEAGMTLKDIGHRLERDHPTLKKILPTCRYAVNGEYASGDRPVLDGDEIAVIPPVSGGSGPATSGRIVRRMIDMGALAGEVSSAKAGAVLTFAGTVREDGGETRRVSGIEYEGYEPMATEVLRRIVEEASARHGVSVSAEHRLGKLGVGEISVGIAVGSAHRASGFEALRGVIEAIKAELPIWKKEEFTDGTAKWVNCDDRAVSG